MVENAEYSWIPAYNNGKYTPHRQISKENQTRYTSTSNGFYNVSFFLSQKQRCVRLYFVIHHLLSIMFQCIYVLGMIIGMKYDDEYDYYHDYGPDPWGRGLGHVP